MYIYFIQENTLKGDLPWTYSETVHLELYSGHKKMKSRKRKIRTSPNGRAKSVPQ